MILIIDNYDSFTFNLRQYLGEVTSGRKAIEVVRNDAVSVDDVDRMKPEHIVLSPGPCTPNEAGICVELVQKLGPRYPILGVCLGHQAIGQAFGGKVIRAKTPTHGKTSAIAHGGKSVFRGLANPFTATRYHSLVVERETLPECLEITAESEDGEIMGIEHKTWRHIQGVQFHPESIMTKAGKQLLANFLS